MTNLLEDGLYHHSKKGEGQSGQGDKTEKPSLMPGKHVAEGAVISDRKAQAVFKKANSGALSVEQTNALFGSVEIVGSGSTDKPFTDAPGNDSRPGQKPTKTDGPSAKDSSPSVRNKPAESEKASPYYKKGDYRIVYDSPGGTRNIAAATSMDRYHYEEVKEDSSPSDKMKDELSKPLDLSTMGIEIPTSLLKRDISIDKNEVNIAGNDQADKFTTNKPVEKNSSDKQKPIPTDVKSSIESIDRSTKPLRDVANLYRTLDKDRNGLSIAEINSGIQDDHYTDREGKGIYDDRAVGLAVLHNHYKEFKGLSADGEQAITPQDIDKFKKIPTLIAMERIAGDAQIVRFLDGNNGRKVNDGKINKTELSETIGDLQDGPTKDAMQVMLADFAIIANGTDSIDTASIKTQGLAMLI